MGDITDAHYAHAKRFGKGFEISWRISWFVYSNRYAIVSWGIWEL